VIALRPDAEALARRGEILLDLQDYAAAAADFEAVLQNTPDADDAVLNLALALEHLGRVADAQRRLVDFVQQHPRHIPALNRLSRLASEQCHAAAAAHATACAEAADWCRRSLAINPDQPEVQARLASVSDRPAADVGHGGG
jgi:lipoprotein NlpI